MNDPWIRFSWWPSSRDFVTNTEPSDLSPVSSRGILGNLGQSTEARPAAHFPPDTPWNTPEGLLEQTWAQSPTWPSVETYDPEALKFAAAWRRMYSTLRPPVFGPASDLSQSYDQRYGQLSNTAERPEFLSDATHYKDWTRGAVLNGRELSPQPSPDANTGNAPNRASQLAGWPSVNASGYPMPAAAAVAASYKAGARPWWAPVSPPDVFDPWRESAEKGLMGLYKFFFDRGSYPSGGNRNDPDCDEEWKAARKECAKWLSTPNRPRGVTGGYRNIEDCARGLVSERCGGNAYEQ